MKVLITGASGFTGNQLINLLSAQGDISIVGVAREPGARFSHLNPVSWVPGDILNKDAIAKTVSLVNPDAIIHLAGANHGSLLDLLTTNVTGTQNILDAALKGNPDCRILIISSSAVYGYAGENAIAEDQPLKPLTEYGLSKTTQDNLCQMYHKTRNCHVAIARPFNLIGPDQPASFVCGKIVQQVIEIEHGRRSSLDLMEIQSRRDFIDVRDVVSAYWALISHKKFREDCAGNAFNIGSGRATPVSTVIDLLQEITGKEYPLHLPASSTSISVPSQKSDNSRINRITGWMPRISLKESLSDMLNASRKKINA
ncbi:MAG: GDP-mannose 4,6-dehydratase [Methanoregula sp.]|nr:GDP-mannose 4,6-dehydratase [Methanoregula sp.]